MDLPARPTLEMAAMLLGPHKDAWAGWRCGVFTDWVRQFREQAEGAPSVEERAEIRDLKRELDRVKRERDILAKAVAFFSASTRENG